MSDVHQEERMKTSGFPLAQRRRSAATVGRRLIVTDLTGIAVAFLLVSRTDASLTGGHALLVLAIVTTGWMSALAAFRTREVRCLGRGAEEFLRVIAAAMASAGATALSLTLLNAPLPDDLALHWAVALTLVLTGRVLWRAWLVRRRDHGDHLVNVMVVGSGAAGLAQHLAATPAAGLNVTSVHELPMTPAQVCAAAVAAQVRSVVLTPVSGFTPSQIRDMRWELETRGLSLLVDTVIAGTDPRRLALWEIDGHALVEVRPRGAGAVRRAAKQIVDRVGALAGLVVLAPLLIVVALLIRAEDGGPVLFRQIRVGQHGAPFAILKFRTMRSDAEQLVAQLQEENEADGPLFKMRDDPRVTRIGRVLRKYSIDELPQLWNVLAGEMSLVGPRPALPSEVAEYNDATRRRLAARPGITGLWQVSGRSDLSWERGVALDVAYIDNWSLLNDALILARTVGAVVRSRGAY